jgi:sulfide:quinone oxidoreductase
MKEVGGTPTVTPMGADATSEATSRFQVLIAGGGVAAVEALLALRALAPDRVRPTLVAPDPTFRYRPLSVTQPFGLGVPRGFDLAEMALANGGSFIHEAISGVVPERRRVRTAGGGSIAYDALLIAIGAQAGTTIPGALAFWDSADRGAYGEIVAELEAGRLRRLAFAVPDQVGWPLGLYELALLTGARVGELGLEDVELTLVTSEPRPLAIFGERAGEVVADLLKRSGVALRVGAPPIGFAGGQLSVRGGRPIPCERAISLPIPEVPRITGLPQDERGFIPVDRFGKVLGLERVFAAGDATWFPVKQGGLATQAADSAASAIAELAGAAVEASPFHPVLRGALLTKWGPRYIRARSHGLTGAASRSALWWPPAKVAGRYLAPYLAARAGYEIPERPLKDLDPPPGDDPTDTASGHEDVVGLALASAEVDAREQDFPGALRWLEVAEDLELYLPREYELKRETWKALTERG